MSCSSDGVTTSTVEAAAIKAEVVGEKPELCDDGWVMVNKRSRRTRTAEKEEKDKVTREKEMQVFVKSAGSNTISVHLVSESVGAVKRKAHYRMEFHIGDK